MEMEDDDFKEFLGKDLDSAIETACDYFNAQREKLEIEIVQDSKSGIFGIVGARKAKIRARRVQLRETVESILGRSGLGDGKGQKAKAPRQQAQQPRREKRPAPAAPVAEVAPDLPHDIEDEDEVNGNVLETAPRKAERPQGRRQQGRGQRHESRHDQPRSGQPRHEQSRQDQPRHPQPRHERLDMADRHGDEGAGEGFPATPLDQLDKAKLSELTLEVARKLVLPIAGEEAELGLSMENGRVKVSVTGCEDSGLLIGREGQTLAALQYIVSRIVSHGLQARVRVQFDAGDYRHNQEEKLREMALALAEKVRQSGRSYSTRPLSSYHRRIIHLCLQDATDVQTHSTGDGPMKRVVITRRKAERA